MQKAEFQFGSVNQYGKVIVMESQVNTEKGSGEFLQIMIPMEVFEDQVDDNGEVRPGMVSINRYNKGGEQKSMMIGGYLVKLFVMKAQQGETESIF